MLDVVHAASPKNTVRTSREFCEPVERTFGCSRRIKEPAGPSRRRFYTGFGGLTISEWGGRSIMKKLFSVYALAAVTFVVGPQILRASDALCPLGNATLHVSYVVSGSGTIANVRQVTAVGEHMWDGQGSTSAKNTISANGNVFSATVTGTYTVNADCTGSLAESDGSHYNFVVAPDGNHLWWIETDTGTVLSGTEVRLRRAAGEK